MATKGALFPCANRSCRQIIDYNEYGLLAYGVKGSIYVLDIRTDPPSILDEKVIYNGHRGRVLSLSFCKSSSNQLLASFGEDMTIKIWDLETATCIASLESEDIFQVIEWLCGTTNVLAFSESRGFVSKWNFITNNCIKIRTGSDKQITAMSSNQKCPELLAVGHAVGTISIVNVNNHTYMKSLRAHVMDIQSVSWSPISPSLLLSTSLDQSVRIWNLEEDKPVHTYYYPSSRYKDKNDDKKNRDSKACSIFHPSNPDVIICSNVRGAFGSVQFNEGAAPKFTPFSTDSFDTNFKAVFRMISYVDVTSENKHIVLSCDPVKITQWDGTDQKLLSSHPWIQGAIFDLDVSPINNNLLAVGAGDGFLKVLNLQNEQKIDYITVYINLKMKLMSVAWHPHNENIIAYGSDEGRVGIIDFSKRKHMYSFETHHTRSVYSLQWGPCNKIKDDKEAFFIYSCGVGNILIHQLGKPKEKAVDFETVVNIPEGLKIDHKAYNELCWKPDYSCLAVGTFNGFVYLYNDNLDFLCHLSLQLKNVEQIKWHPLHTYSSHTKESQYSSWFAAIGNDENIHVFDSQDVLSKPPEGGICKPTKTLVGHKKRVSAICWSVHTDGHLVSGGRDGAVQVWNVITAVPIANYLWHKEKVYSVLWSVLDPDVVYSGGADCSLRIWKISEQNQEEIPAKLHVVKHKSYKPPKSKPPSDENTVPEIVDSSVKGESKCETLISENGKVSEAHLISENVKPKTRQGNPVFDLPKEREGAIFLPSKSSSKEEILQNVFKLVDFLCDESVLNDAQIINTMNSEFSELGLFADQFNVLKMLEAKGKMEMSSKKKSNAAYLQIMACNVNELLTEAAEKKELNDFLVSISPSVSHNFWLSMCEKYAVQLIEEQQFTKGCMYFVICGKIYDAMKILFEKGRFLDALALAKSRLPEGDPFIRSSILKLAALYRTKKQVENEAACFIALKDPLHAAKTLFCAGDAKFAFASVYICCKFNLTEAAQEYAVLCVEKCLSQNDWPTFYKVAEMVEYVKVYKILIRVHEIISSHIKALKKEDAVVGNDIFGVTGIKILIWSGKGLENSNVYFITYLYDVLKSEGLLPEDKTALQDIHHALVSLKTRKSEISTEAHINVAIYISEVIITSLLGDLDSAVEYFTKILPCTYNVVFMPKIISWVFFPFDVYWCSKKNTFLCEVKQMNLEVLLSFSHFQDIFNAVCNRFACIRDSEDEVLTIPQTELHSHLTVQQVLTFLSRKTTEDSILLYFTTFYLSELRRVAKKGWKFRCYDNDQISTVTPEDVTCLYNNEKGQWVVNSNTSGFEKSISKEDVLKLNLQNKFKLNIIGDTSLDVPNITDVISHIFSSEIELNSKDELVQHYGFKDVSDFLQIIMSDIKANISLENQQSDSVEIQDGLKDECKVTLVSPEDEDLHAQCWTNVSLYYVLVKLLFSIICRDEYALLYYLQKHMLSLDRKIADLARSQSTRILNQKSEQTQDIKEIKRNLNLSMKNDVIHEKKVEPNIVMKLENKGVKDSNDHADLTDAIISDDNVSSGKIDEYEITEATELIDSADKSLSLDDTILNNKVDGLHLPGKITVEEINQENKIAVLNEENKSLEENSVVSIHNSTHFEKAQDTISVCSNKTEIDNDDSFQEKLENKDEKYSKAPENNHVHLTDITLSDDNVNGKTDECEVTEVIELNDNTDKLLSLDPILNNKVDTLNLPDKVSDEEINVENKIAVLNEENKSFKKENSVVSIHNSTHLENNQDTITVCSSKTDITENGSDDYYQQKLRLQRENLAHQIKLLELQELWYPDPFVSVVDIKAICCDIFHKNPCVLIKQKFHEFLHEVDQWYTKFCLTDAPNFCDICKKIST